MAGIIPKPKFNPNPPDMTFYKALYGQDRIINVNPDWTTTVPLLVAANKLFLRTNELDNVLLNLMALVDPTTGQTFGIANPLHIQVVDANTSTHVAVVSSPTEGTGDYALDVSAVTFVYNSIGGIYERVRTPNTFKSVTCTTVAATAVWTPVAGKKFRIMGLVVMLASGSAIAAASTWELQDAAASIKLAGMINGAALAAAVLPNMIANVDLKPNGYLSTTVNNVLNCIMTTAITTGGLSFIVWGTEE